jgi:hypothetical protein
VDVLDDGEVGSDAYGQVEEHAFRLAHWEGQHPPMKDQEGPHRAQKNARYIKSAPEMTTKSQEKIIPARLNLYPSPLQYLASQIPK